MAMHRAMQFLVDDQWGAPGFEALLEAKAALGATFATGEHAIEARPPDEALA